MIFSISETGSSHLPKNIPCQDFSDCYESPDGSVKLVIVSDGHGEACCCRSNRGSFFAAKACKDVVLSMLGEISGMVAGKGGAVTAKPAGMDQLWGKQKMDPSSELYQNLRSQAELYGEQSKNSLEVELLMRRLFESIRDRWLEKVHHDLFLQDLTEGERLALGNRPLERAYGTTLMCYVQTGKFWIAFQVGDGRVLLLNEGWNHPVPWDCRCFMNRTTSLCGDDAVDHFRYAFDGSGNFPVAAFCCSDGVEDSFGDYEGSPQGLHDFASQVVTSAKQDGVSKTLENLHEALPEISRLRSHDDMSLAVVIN